MPCTCNLEAQYRFTPSQRSATIPHIANEYDVSLVLLHPDLNYIFEAVPGCRSVSSITKEYRRLIGERCSGQLPDLFTTAKLARFVWRSDHRLHPERHPAAFR